MFSKGKVEETPLVPRKRTQGQKGNEGIEDEETQQNVEEQQVQEETGQQEQAAPVEVEETEENKQEIVKEEYNVDVQSKIQQFSQTKTEEHELERKQHTETTEVVQNNNEEVPQEKQENHNEEEEIKAVKTEE